MKNQTEWILKRIKCTIKNMIAMETQFQIPRDILAQIDYQNTVNGGMVETLAKAWTTNDGYNMVVNAPTIDPEKVQVQVADKRFMVFMPVRVLEGAEYIPHFLVNIPVSPDVDIENISAKWRDNGHLHIKAPFNSWEKGEVYDIDIDF
jgi:HSP20 family protein